MRSSRPRLLLGVVACGLLIAAWYLTLAPTRIGGPLTPVIVRGTSMLPTYETGDLVIAYRASDPAPDEVAVFGGPSGGYVIHRIVALEGERVVTRGDNRVQADPWDTTVPDVLGTARFHVPGAGTLLLRLADPLVVGALAGAAAASVVLWPRRERAARPVGGSSLAGLVVVLALAPVIAMAAGITVTTDELTSLTLTGPFDTYVDAPGGGGGGGGCNGSGNQPGC